MHRFLVTLCGENYRLSMEEEADTYGFFTTRYVNASDEEAAKCMALMEFKQSQRYQELLEQADIVDGQPPSLEVDEIEEVGLESVFENGELPGLSFFPMGETK